MINPKNDPSRKIEMLREKQLYQAFEEIFGIKEINPLSNEYYRIIQTMIENGTLKALGYTLNEKNLDEDFLIDIPKR